MEYAIISVPGGMGYAAAVSDGKGLVKFYLPVENNDTAVNEVQADFPGAVEKDTPLLKETTALVKSYFKGIETGFGQLPVSLPGSMPDFSRRALTATAAIPYGQTRTYKWVAQEAGDRDAARAAGNALNRSPLPLIIPCHRVIQSGGEIGGFSAGLKWKIRLLQIEKILK